MSGPGAASAEGARSPGPSPSWPAPRLARAALLLSFVLLAVLAIREVDSYDIGFHLRAGRDILSGRGWPRTDTFTYTVNDHPYVDTSWGYQVLVALVDRAAGAPGISLLHALLALVPFLIVVRTARLGRASPHLLAIGVFLGALAVEMRFAARPELLSYALLALVVHILHRRAERGDPPLWALPIVFLVWSNAHALVALGWAALAAFVAGGWIRDRRLDRRLAAWSAASIAVGAVNPYGLTGLLFPFTLLSRMNPGNPLYANINEFISPIELVRSPLVDRAMPSTIALFAFTLLAVPALWRSARERRWGPVLLTAAFLVLAERMIRNVPPLVLAGIPLIAWSAPPSAARRARAHLDRLLPMASAAVLILAALLALRVVHQAYYIEGWRDERLGLGWNGRILPVEAVAWADRARLTGRVLNHLGYGGYLLADRSDPVYIDGRLEVIGEQFFLEYDRVFSDRAALDDAVRRYGIRWAVYPHRSRELLRIMSADPGWKLVHADPLSVVWTRTDLAVEPDPVLRSQSGPAAPVDVRSLPGLGGPRRPGRLSTWLLGAVRSPADPVADFGWGIFWWNLGRPDHAAERFAAAVRVTGGRAFEMYEHLGLALAALGRFQDAHDCLAVVLEEHPGRVQTRRIIEEVDRRLPPP